MSHMIQWKNKLGEFLLGPFSYAHNRLYTKYNTDFMTDEKFSGAFNKAAELTAMRHPAPFRVYVNCWAASHAMKLDGDLVECGVWKGFTSRAMIEYTGFRNSHKKFYLVDSFEGLKEEDITPEERERGIRNKKRFNNTYKDNCRVFSDIDNAILVKGYIPEVLDSVAWGKISYLHIDLTYTYPEIAAARFFWDKMTTGGIVIVNNFGWHRMLLLKRAFDDFARERGVEVLTLPTGQGLILKL